MADRETVEKNKIKKNIRDTKAQGRKAKRKRNLKLAIFCTIFSIIVILGSAYVIVHCISNKESLRDAGIAAFKEGNYSEAISDFDASLNEAIYPLIVVCGLARSFHRKQTIADNRVESLIDIIVFLPIFLQTL